MSHQAVKRLPARAWIRAMTTADGHEGGGSQPHVFDTHDGYYMVKVSNNPQGAKVLLNELLAGICMDWLGVHHPGPAVIAIPEEVISSSPEARFQDGTPLAHGLAFGSQYWQSDPQAAVDPSLLTNRANIAATTAFDTWVVNGDGRQYRVRQNDADPNRYDYIPVDQGHSFGYSWTIDTLRATTDLVVPDAVVPLGPDDLAAPIRRLREFDLRQADAIVDQVPDEWWSEDEKAAARDYLLARAPAAADAIEKKYPPIVGDGVTP